MPSPRRLSGMQKQVLCLYRGFLRAARQKSPEERKKIESIVAAKFRDNAKNVDRKNSFYIEYLMRRGKKQLDQLNSHGTVGLSIVQYFQLTSSKSTAEDAPSEDRILNPTTAD